MDRTIRNMLGLVDGGKRIYQIDEEQVVEKEEFEYAKVIDGIVFGDKGYAETLGPTWTMIHDPRFFEIENCFIMERRNVFGGDTRLGKQFIGGRDGITFAESTEKDLEQYSEIIGEGRVFCEALRKRGDIHPRDMQYASDDVVWEFIKEMCPNYWTRPGKDKDGIDIPSRPNALAHTLFRCIKSDMLGLIWDYCMVANVQEWVLLDSGDLVTEEQMKDIEVKRVWLEVDLLEKALTFRSILRCTAVKILNNEKLKGLCPLISMSDRIKLTDFEADELLRIVYASNWPDDVLELAYQINNLLVTCPASTYDQRHKSQLEFASRDSRKICKALKNGEIQPVTRFTDPEVELNLTTEQRIAQELHRNPLKAELYLMYADAEKLGWKEIIQILTPVVTDPDFVVDEEVFNRLAEECDKHIPEEYKNKPVQTVEGVNQVTLEAEVSSIPLTTEGIRQLDAEIQREMIQHEAEDRKPN